MTKVAVLNEDSGLEASKVSYWLQPTPSISNLKKLYLTLTSLEISVYMSDSQVKKLCRRYSQGLVNLKTLKILASTSSRRIRNSFAFAAIPLQFPQLVHLRLNWCENLPETFALMKHSILLLKLKKLVPYVRTELRSQLLVIKMIVSKYLRFTRGTAVYVPQMFSGLDHEQLSYIKYLLSVYHLNQAEYY